MGKTYNKVTFTSKRLNKEVTLSKRQQFALDTLCEINFHSEIRVALAELFNAPKYIKKELRTILNNHHTNNGLSWADIELRKEYTTKLNNFIKRNYGVKAYNFAISVQ